MASIMYNMENSITVPLETKKIKQIRNVSLLLGIVTLIEFLLAFTMPRSLWLVALFITLTCIKAFYIVAEFMHLKYEVKALISALLIPLILLLWLVVALLVEGGTTM